MSLTVKVTDDQTGESDETTVSEGDYLLITHDPCYQAGVQVFEAGSTHVITVKGRRVEEASDG